MISKCQTTLIYLLIKGIPEPTIYFLSKKSENENKEEIKYFLNKTKTNAFKHVKRWNK